MQCLKHGGQTQGHNVRGVMLKIVDEGKSSFEGSRPGMAGWNAVHSWYLVRACGGDWMTFALNQLKIAGDLKMIAG